MEKQQDGFGELGVVGAIPYGFVGVFAALWAMGQPFGFMAFLGIVSLVGVIVSHVIVLFDFIEEARDADPGAGVLLDRVLDLKVVRWVPGKH